MTALITRREEARALRLASAQPKTTADLTKFLSELASRMADFATAEPQVRERLGQVRNRVLAVDYREEKPEKGKRTIRLAEVGFYDYDHDVLVVAVIDPFAAK